MGDLRVAIRTYQVPFNLHWPKCRHIDLLKYKWTRVYDIMNDSLREKKKNEVLTNN